jgi:uncharacterized protein YabE (DUF348 family)
MNRCCIRCGSSSFENGVPGSVNRQKVTGQKVTKLLRQKEIKQGEQDRVEILLAK